MRYTYPSAFRTDSLLGISPGRTAQILVVQSRNGRVRQRIKGEIATPAPEARGAQRTVPATGSPDDGNGNM